LSPSVEIHSSPDCPPSPDLLGFSVGQTIKIRRVGANKEGLARVVGCYKDPSAAGRVFGLALSDRQINLWDIVFPPAAGQEEAVLRSLLRKVA